jgi:hypothetical protein
MVSAGQIPPVLIRRDRRQIRHPAYAIPYKLWSQICDQYPDLVPSEAEIGETYPGRYFRDMLGEHILIPAFREGKHSFAKSESSTDSWHVAFVPRLWFEIARERMVQDGTLGRA